MDWGGREGVWSRLLHTPFPSPFLSFPVPSPAIPSPPRPSSPLPLEVGPLIQLEGLGERCKLTQRGQGRSLGLN